MQAVFRKILNNAKSKAAAKSANINYDGQVPGTSRMGEDAEEVRRKGEVTAWVLVMWRMTPRWWLLMLTCRNVRRHRQRGWVDLRGRW